MSRRLGLRRRIRTFNGAAAGGGGPALAWDIGGYAFTSVSASDFYEMDTSGAPRLSSTGNGMTYMFLLRTINNGTGGVMGTFANTAPPYGGVEFTVDPANRRLTVRLGDDATLETEQMAGAIPFEELGSWMRLYVTMAQNGANVDIVAYVNGVQKGTATATFGITLSEQPASATWNPRLLFAADQNSPARSVQVASFSVDDTQALDSSAIATEDAAIAAATQLGLSTEVYGWDFLSQASAPTDLAPRTGDATNNNMSVVGTPGNFNISTVNPGWHPNATRLGCMAPSLINQYLTGAAGNNPVKSTGSVLTMCVVAGYCHFGEQCWVSTAGVSSTLEGIELRYNSTENILVQLDFVALTVSGSALTVHDTGKVYRHYFVFEESGADVICTYYRNGSAVGSPLTFTGKSLAVVGTVNQGVRIGRAYTSSNYHTRDKMLSFSMIDNTKLTAGQIATQDAAIVAGTQTYLSGATYAVDFTGQTTGTITSIASAVGGDTLTATGTIYIRDASLEEMA